MTTDDIIELAKQAGFWQEHINTYMCITQDIERFAHLVHAAALEEAAEAVDQTRCPWGSSPKEHYIFIIRQLKEKK